MSPAEKIHFKAQKMIQEKSQNEKNESIRSIYLLNLFNSLF